MNVQVAVSAFFLYFCQMGNYAFPTLLEMSAAFIAGEYPINCKSAI